MFDIGFFELLLVAIVGLLVIGPEQLPSTIKSLAMSWARFKRGLSNTKQEFEKQIGADDIRRQLHNEEIMNTLKATDEKLSDSYNENVAAINKSLTEETAKVAEPSEAADADIKNTDTPS